MERVVPPSTELVCRVGYTGDVSVFLDAAAKPVVQPYTIKIFLERRERDPLAPVQLTERKGVGKITFGASSR